MNKESTSKEIGWKEELDELLDSQRGKTWLVIRPLLKDFFEKQLKEEKEVLLEKVLDRAWVHLDEVDIESGKELPENIGWNDNSDDMVSFLANLKEETK